MITLLILLVLMTGIYYCVVISIEARKAALHCNNQKGNSHSLMLRLALIIELVPDKAS